MTYFLKILGPCCNCGQRELMVNQPPLVNGVQLTTCQMVTISRTNRDRPPTGPARKHANTPICLLFGIGRVLYVFCCNVDSL